MLHAPSPRLRATLAAIGAPLCWSVGGVVIRSVDAGPWDVVFWRSGSHAIVLGAALVFLFKSRPIVDFRRAGWIAWISALMLAGVLTFHVLAIMTTTVANVLIIQSISPILVALLAPLLLRERVDFLGATLLAIAFAGLVPVLSGSLAAAGGEERLAGDLLALAVVACSTINVLLIRRWRAFNLVPATVIAGALAAASALPFTDPFAISARDMSLLFMLGIVQNVAGVTLFYSALRSLPAAEVTLLALLEPVLGPIWVWLFIGEEPAVTTLIGGTIVLGALLLKCIADLRRRASAAAPAS